MSQLSKTLVGIGAVLVFLSFSVNSVIYVVESQANTYGSEALIRIVEQINERRKVDSERTISIALGNDDELNSFNNGKDELLVISDPLMAQVKHNQAVVPLQRTPALVPIGNAPYTLTTEFREQEFSQEELVGENVEIKLRPFYRVLCYLFIPGFICLGLGWVQQKAGTSESQVRPNNSKDRSSSLDTVLRSGPPQSPDGLFDHDSSTPEELRYGRFVRGDVIGKGAMGEVFRCTSCLPGDNNTYALKVLLPEWGKAEDFRTRFEREADICRKLDHPNLVRAYGRGEKGGRLWLVMDFVDGEELETWLQSEHSEQELTKMFQSISQGLEHAHKSGVVHRDLKPGNILVRRSDQQPVVADFGLAKGKHYATITKTNTTLGTPTYMAPEQISGGKGSPQSDLYSLGCIMYEALAGVPPFEDKDVMALLMKKLSQEPPPELLADKASPKLREIVDKLLAYSLEERYQSAAELIEALKA